MNSQSISTPHKTLQELIISSPCDLRCLSGGKKGVGCGCLVCARKGGYWEIGEFEERVKGGFLTEDEVVMIKRIIEEGALGDDGCKLERRMRSRLCLEYDCKDK